jgi:hypothetical protein
MKKILLFITTFFISTCFSAQAQKYMIDIEIGFLRFNNDSIKFKKPQSLTINTTGCTEIFSIGKSRKHEFGMKVEILPSKLNGKEEYLIGKIYYIKNNNEWQEVINVTHALWNVNPISKREKPDIEMMGGASIDSPDVYDVRLNDSYYVIK